MFNARENIAIFIDGANLFATSKLLRWDIDYSSLLKYYQRRGRIVRASYYTALLDPQHHSNLRPLVDFLDYNGYQMVTKEAKTFTHPRTGEIKIKGNMDIEIAVDAMKLAEHIDTMILFSGDGDFKSLVAAMQDKGVRVEVVSTMIIKPPMIADELRRQANLFIEINTMSEQWARTQEGGMPCVGDVT